MSVNHSVPAHGAGSCTFSHPSVLNASIFQQIEFILCVCFLHKSSYFLSYVSASSALPSCSYPAAVGIKVSNQGLALIRQFLPRDAIVLARC